GIAFAAQSGDLLAGSASSFTVFRAADRWKATQVTRDPNVREHLRDVLRILVGGNIALVVSRRGPAFVIDVGTARIVTTVGGQTSSLIVDGALSSDGTFAALRDLDGKLIVYKVPSGEEVWRSQATSGGGGIAFSMRGVLAVASGGEIELLDSATG